MSVDWRVAVLGGCGFIGRNVVDYLIRNDLAAYVRVVDKVPPQMAWLNKSHLSVFENPKVEFKSANLILPASCASALKPNFDGTWDLVINCAGETKTGQTDSIYKEGILVLCTNCIEECVRLNVKKYIEISSGFMQNSEKKSHKECEPIKPWTIDAKWKSQVETMMKKYASKLNYTILRPAIIYGVGDRRGITPRLLVGAIYKNLGETMKLLWTPDLKLNTVHILDLCRAIIFLSDKNEAIGQIYNIVDSCDTTQGKITELISNIFNVNHDYWGVALSKLAKNDLEDIVEEANDKHLAAWASMCSAAGVQNTPLDPTMTAELLLNKNIYLDGSKLESLGFKIEQENITEEKLREVINDFIEMGVFPKNLIT